MTAKEAGTETADMEHTGKDGTKKEPEACGMAYSAGTQALLEENKRLKEENERLRKLPLKERMYDKIHVSVRTLDIIIVCLCVLFVLVVAAGMMK